MSLIPLTRSSAHLEVAIIDVLVAVYKSAFNFARKKVFPCVVYRLTRYLFQSVTRRFCFGGLSSGFVFNKLRMVK